MKKNRLFVAGFLLCILPFAYCFVAKRTLVPMQALYSTILPYCGDQSFAPPNNHFWSDTVDQFMPRLFSLSRHEFPISYSSGGGGPLYADTINSYFSPFAWITFGLFQPSVSLLDLMWLIQLLVYFSGLFFWLSAAGAPPLGAILAALTQAYSTAIFPGSYMAFQTLGCLTFLPWAFWAENTGKNSIRRLWLPQLFLSLCIYSGNIQTATYPLLAFGFWLLLEKRLRFLAYSILVVVFFTLPLWLTGIQYHILLSVQNLAERRSQVPNNTLERLLALFALPGIFLPELFGSSKSIDLLKAFKTSITYFIGSIGLLGPALALASLRPSTMRKTEIRLALLLIAFCVFAMATPLLNFLYYRVICLICLGLSILLAFAFADLHVQRAGKTMLAGAVAILMLIVGASVGKLVLHKPLTTLFRLKLAASKYSWVPGLVESRIDRWFATYMLSPHVVALPFLMVIAYFALKARRQAVIAALIVTESLLLWTSQVTFDPVRPAEHPAFQALKEELQQSPSYPASRYMSVVCATDKPFLFYFSTQEFQGVPGLIYYGSTNVTRLPEPDTICSHTDKSIKITNPEILQASAINVLVTPDDWTLLNPGFTRVRSGPGYAFWKQAPRTAIWENPVATDPPRALEVRTLSWNHSRIEWTVRAKAPVRSWSMSLPYYPGWRYEMDGKEILPKRFDHSVPNFTHEINPGEHRVSASFRPITIYWGLAGSLFAIFLVLIAVLLERSKIREPETNLDAQAV